MKIINYTPKFYEAIELAKSKRLFLGFGNPDAQILILGKEAAIDKEKNPRHYEVEITNNVHDWEINFNTNKQFDEIESWFINNGKSTYNPLYPYKGQKNTIESRNKEGKIVRGEFGTSKTWYNYQKISDTLFNGDKSSTTINFLEHVFISELNQETGKYSHLVSKDKREQSIANRVSLFETSFFKNFPITIVAVGHYVRDFNINLETIFGMTYDAEMSKIHSEGLKNEYINIHFDSLEQPTKLLIHTNQLSMVSNELIKKLGEVCSSFVKGKNQ